MFQSLFKVYFQTKVQKIRQDECEVEIRQLFYNKNNRKLWSCLKFP